MSLVPATCQAMHAASGSIQRWQTSQEGWAEVEVLKVGVDKGEESACGEGEPTMRWAFVPWKANALIPQVAAIASFRGWLATEVRRLALLLLPADCLGRVHERPEVAPSSAEVT